MKNLFKCEYDFKLQNIGSGSYGEVSIVEKDGQKYAYKKIKVDKIVKQSSFYNPIELDISFRLQSPYLVRGDDITLATECTNKEVGLITEYIDGNLSKDIDRMSFAQRKRIMYDIAQGLKCMHDNNYLHLDIKMDNVMYRKEEQPRGVLIDYGLSSYTPYGVDEGVHTYQGRYTFQFNSPESIPRTDELGEVYYYNNKNDIWALGIFFMEVMCGNEFNYVSQDIWNLYDELKDNIKSYKELSKYQTYNFSDSRIDKFLNDFAEVFNFKSIENLNLLIDLLKNMLKVNSKLRFNINQVVEHPFFEKFRSNRTCFVKQPKLYENDLDIQEYYSGVNEIIDIAQEEYYERTSYILFMAVDIYIRFLHNIKRYPDVKDRIISMIPELPRICLLIANKYFYWSEYNADVHIGEMDNVVLEENLIYKIIGGRVRDERYFTACNNVEEVRFVYDYFINPGDNEYNPNLAHFLSYNGKEFMDNHRIESKKKDCFHLKIGNL